MFCVCLIRHEHVGRVERRVYRRMLHHGYLCKVCGTVSPRDFPWPALLHKKGKETVRNPTERTESRTEGAITAVEQSRASQSVRRSARTCTGRSPVHPAARFRSMLPCGQAPTVLCRWRAGFLRSRMLRRLRLAVSRSPVVRIEIVAAEHWSGSSTRTSTCGCR